MNTIPQVGVYVSTKKIEGMRLIVENAYGEDPNDFYLVEVIDEASKDDSSVMGDELDKEQWETLVDEYGLVFQG